MKQKVALVLSGGGARGTAHIGVIEEIERLGFEISSIAGTSMGSVVGGVYALGKLDTFKTWISSLDLLKVLSLVDITIGNPGLIKAEKVLKKMKEFTGNENIESLSIPFVAIATDILNNQEVVFAKGSIYDAIRASIAIPSVITPVKTETGILVDGGVLNNIPVNHVNRTPGDILIVVDVNAPIPLDLPLISKKKKEESESLYQKKIKEFYAYLHKANPVHKEDKLGYTDVVSRSIYLMINQIARLQMQNYKPDILIEISHEACGTFDFYKANQVIEIGRHAAKKQIEFYLEKQTVY